MACAAAPSAGADGPCSLVTFHVRCRSAGGDEKELEEWDALYISGTGPVLGDWSLERAVPMQTEEGRFPRWRSPQLRLPLGPRLEYKYMLRRSLREEDRMYVHWEEFVKDYGQEHKEVKNRILSTENLPPVCEVLDAEFGRPELNEDAELRSLHSPVNLFIAVHGERFQEAHPSMWRQWQSKKEFNPYDDPLSKTGMEMARLCGERLRGENIQEIYAGLHTRCVQTAAEIQRAIEPGAPVIRLEEGIMDRVEQDFPSAETSIGRILCGDFPDDAPCWEHSSCRIDEQYEPAVPCAWQLDKPFRAIGYSEARELNMTAAGPPYYEHPSRRQQLLAFRLMQRHQGGHSSHGGRGGRGGRGRGGGGHDGPVPGAVPGVLWVGHRGFDEVLLEWLVPGRWDWKLCRCGSITKISFVPGGWGLELELDRDPAHVAHLLKPAFTRPVKVAEDAWRTWPRKAPEETIYDYRDPYDSARPTQYTTQAANQTGNEAWKNAMNV